MSAVHHCEEHGFTEEEVCSSCRNEVEQVLSSDQQRDLSGFMSWALRHEPENAGIEVDDNGWTTVKKLIRAAKDQYPFTNQEAIEGIVALDGKGRYELSEDKVRAVYAHSFPVTIDSSSDNVPDTLLHGTPSENVQSILSEGLKPMGREKVHLTPDKDEALDVGKRHDEEVVILEIDAESLQKSGQTIEERGEKIYTTSHINPEYIKVQ